MAKRFLVFSIVMALTPILSIFMGNAVAKAKVGNVSIWNSAIAPGPGIAPVGGSGQIPGFFLVDTGKAKKTGEVQVGIRAQERAIGPLIPDGKKYFATAGIFNVGTPDPNRATWNFDFHLDFGSGLSETIGSEATEPIGPTDHTMDDFQVTLIADCDPSPKNKPIKLDLSAGFPGLGLKLLQESWNMGFGFLQVLVCVPQGLAGFDFDAEGTYEFGIEVREKKKGKGDDDSSGKSGGSGKSGKSGSGKSGSGKSGGSGGKGGKLIAKTKMLVIVQAP